MNNAALRIGDDEGPLIENLAFLPEQISQNHRWSPELRLIFAEMLDAIDVLQRAAFVTSTAFRRQAWTDTMWILSTSEAPFSFIWMCEELGMDAAATREGLEPLFIRKYPERLKGEARVRCAASRRPKKCSFSQV